MWMLLLLLLVTGRLISYYVTCYVLYLLFLVLLLYFYVKVVLLVESKPFLNIDSGQPLLQIPGRSLWFRSVVRVLSIAAVQFAFAFCVPIDCRL